MTKPITSHSEQGRRIHDFLCRELNIPVGARSVKVEYGVGQLFAVTIDYLPRAPAEIDATTQESRAAEFVRGDA